ncbi:MAG: TIM barrel protein [Anaerolineae bacterium]|nr:TIM barrel protein [Anaerolineae bacterium]
MFSFAVNLTFLFTETPFLERFARARACGFRAVEFHNPYPYIKDGAEIVRTARQAKVEIIHFSLPVQGWEKGNRGIAAHPDLKEEFCQSVATAVQWARQLGCRQLNCPVGNRADGYTLEQQHAMLVENLRYAAEATAQAGITLLLEPLNPLTHPTYLLTTTRRAFQLQDMVNAPNLKVQYDYYQMQRSEGELAETVRRNLSRIGFIQLADNPGRQQPGTGEIRYPFLLADLASSAYDGFVSLEYSPLGKTEDSFGWMREFGAAL